jgi:hypothetical protein
MHLQNLVPKIILSIVKLKLLSPKTHIHCFCFIPANREVHIRHQCRKTTVLSCHRCIINTGVEKNEQHLKLN